MYLNALIALGLLVCALAETEPLIAAYRYQICYYEVGEEGSDAYLLTGYDPACRCLPDPTTKDCTCFTSAGPGPNCTKARCFAIDSPFYAHIRGYYLSRWKLATYVGNSGYGGYAHWDYDMAPKIEQVVLANPCGVPELSVASGETSSTVSDNSAEADRAAIFLSAAAAALGALLRGPV